MSQPSTLTRRLTVASLLLGASVLLSRLLGFVRDAVIAATLGAGAETDAYFAAFTLPDLLNYFLLGGALSITFVPLYGRLRAGPEPERADRLVSVVISTLGAILLALTVLGEVLAPALVSVLFPGFDAAQLARTTELTRLVMPGQLAFFVGGVLSAVLMVHERFRPVALAPLVYNASIIVFGAALSPIMGAGGFSVGALVGAFLGPLGVPLWACRGLVRFRPRMAPVDPLLRQYLRLSLPLMVGVTLLTADEWIGRYLGSSLEPGTISWLNNARRLMLVPFALIGQAAGQAALPFLSRLAAEDRHGELGETLSRTLRATIFLSILAAVGLAVLAEPATIAVYERGAFTATDSAKTASFLLLFSPAVVAWATQTVAVRGFYAHVDTWRPMLLGTAVTLASLPIYVVLVDAIGGPGLALATSIGLALNALGTLVLFQRTHGGLDVRGLAATLVRGALVAAVAGIPVALLLEASALDMGRSGAAWVETALGGGLFLAIAIGASGRLRGPEGEVVRRLLRRFRLSR